MVKKLITLIKPLFGLDLIQWRFTVKKDVHNIYNIHIIGLISHPYRLSAQGTSLEGPLPINIEFENTAFILLNEKVKEIGMQRESFYPAYNSRIKYYSYIVNFVQEVYVYNAPKMLKGKIRYMPHTEKKCLSLKVKSFQIELS